MRSVLIVVSAAVLILLPSFAQCVDDNLVSRDRLIADSRQMLTLLESVHPQPYFRGGGKVAFHRRFQALLNSIPETGMTREGFRGLISPFVAAVGDGHTHVYPDVATDFSGIPLLFYVVEDELYVAAVLEESHRRLLGARLLAVEGVTLPELVDRTRHYYGADNRYGTLGQLANFELFLAKAPILADLVPEWRDHQAISVTFRMPEDTVETVSFQAQQRESFDLMRPEDGLALPPLNGREFAWGFLDADRRIAYLRVKGMVANRETYEKRATYSDISEEVSRYYQSLHGASPGKSVEDTISVLPSLTETYTGLTKQMRQARSRALIVDLRTNVGGWALAADMLVYFLYGKEALINLHRRTNVAVRKLSPRYFNSEPDLSLEQINAQRRESQPTAFPLTDTDYDFSDLMHLDDGLLSRDYAQRMVEDDLALSRTFYDEYESGAHSGYYLPGHVMVLVDVATFSAGFMFAKYLELMGATVIGTTPSQSIVHMGETMPFVLQHSGLGGDIARSLLILDTQLEYLPGDEPLMQPDHDISYEQLKSYDFARHAAVLYALDILEGPVPDPVR